MRSWSGGGVPFKEEFIGPGEQGEKQRCVTEAFIARITLTSLHSLDIMHAMKAIHDVGYEHTDLVEPDFRHLLYDTERQRPYIIDFSRGEKHKCHPRMAIKAYKTPPDPYVFGCMELRDLGVAIGLFGLGPCACFCSSPFFVAHIPLQCSAPKRALKCRKRTKSSLKRKS